MGGERAYIQSGGFKEYLYHQVGETITANGISGKVIQKYNDNSHSGLPNYSNTSEVYFKLDDETQTIEQAKVYKDRKMLIDFDWGHNHGSHKKGVVHVHEWYKDDNGVWKRGEARMMNNKEMKKYGPLLKKANPNIKFR